MVAVGVPLTRALRFPCGALLMTFVERSGGLHRSRLLYFKIQYYTVFLINRTALEVLSTPSVNASTPTAPEP